MLQLIYMGVSIAASAWVMRWLISAIDPEKENKKRVGLIESTWVDNLYLLCCALIAFEANIWRFNPFVLPSHHRACKDVIKHWHDLCLPSCRHSSSRRLCKPV